MRDQLRMSWVTLDRFCQEEAAKDEPLRRKLEADNRPLRSAAAKLTDGELLDKLRSMGFELDRSGVRNLCAGALSAEEVARPLHRDWEARNPDRRPLACFRGNAFSGLARNQREPHLPGPSPDRLLRGGGQDCRLLAGV